ncbi:hypothetical protein OG478_01400 [Streptomyces phaeochromogenes]|uniref:hypothetical protein n=1 Tax=Streptomyces phaeochromogenes TaxID=1923 RepID=UPI00386D6762|nr:hypothetical protein OG478_01400 [Streptomyces phaeochromogenes]
MTAVGKDGNEVFGGADDLQVRVALPTPVGVCGAQGEAARSGDGRHEWVWDGRLDSEDRLCDLGREVGCSSQGKSDVEMVDDVVTEHQRLLEDVLIEDRIVHGLCQVMGVSPVARFARFEIIARRIMLSEWVGLVS